MKQVHLLYDVGLLATVPPSRRSGLCRMTEVVLQRLALCQEIVVWPCLWTKDKYLSQRLDELGLGDLKKRIIRLPLLRYHTDDIDWKRRFKGRLFSWWGRRKYASLWKRFDCLFGSYLRIPDVIYESGLPVISFVHDMIPIVHPEYSEPDFVLSYTRWMQAVQSDVLLCDSENSRSDFLKFRPDYPERQAHVVYLGVEEKFRPDSEDEARDFVCRRYGIPEKRYFFALSADSPRKNFMHLMEAFEQFSRRIRKQDIVLVIGGPKTRHLEAFLNKHPALRSRVILAGFIDDRDLPVLYAGAEAFIYPSLYEGFGLPPLEAMACGTPVICCDNSSLPEVCGDAAVYIDGKDICRTALALERVYASHRLRETMRKKGLARAELFSWDKTVRQICSFIINIGLSKRGKNDTKKAKNSIDYRYYRTGRRILGQISS